MVLYIVKRDGSLATFDEEKIISAINKAFIDVDGDLYETDTAKDIAQEIKNIAKNSEKNLTVEEIQDLVEKFLMDSERKDVAQSYIRYRYKKEIARNQMSDFIKAIREKLNGSNIQNQNANMDESSFGGRTGEASSVVTKQLALDYIISPMARYNHLNNRIYIHDLDSYYVGSHNCLSIPFDKLLAEGFETRQTDVRPAGSLNTAFQLVAVIFQLQSLQQFGGVSATHLDWTMVPYVRKSFYKHYCDGMKYLCNCDWNLNNYLEDSDTYKKIIDIPINDYSAYLNEADDAGDFDKVYQYAMDMTLKEVHQAVEGMYHNLNTLQSRSGN